MNSGEEGKGAWRGIFPKLLQYQKEELGKQEEMATATSEAAVYPLVQMEVAEEHEGSIVTLPKNDVDEALLNFNDLVTEMNKQIKDSENALNEHKSKFEIFKEKLSNYTKGLAKATPDVGVFSENAVDQALSNSLIVHNIFGYLSSSDLANARLVSQSWDSCAVSLKLSPFTLNVSTLPKKFKYLEVLKMECKLFRRITADSDASFDLHDICEFEVGPEVQHIDWKHTWPSCNLMYMLKKNKFPNLKSLTGRIGGEISITEEYITSDHFPTMKNLKKLTLTICMDYNYTARSRDMLQVFLQRLVNVAPKLEELKLDDNIFLDLSHNTKLKKLSFETDVPIEVDKLRILIAHQNQLERLVLESKCQYGEDGPKPNLQFPSMPHLKSLSLRGLYDKEVGRHLKNLSPKVLPNLSVLELSKEESECHPSMNFLKELAQSLEEQDPFVHPNVKTLVLKGIEDPRLLKNLQQHFPNLRRLEVEILKRDMHDDDSEDEHSDDDDSDDEVYEPMFFDEEKLLENFFESTKTLPIQHLRLDFVFDLQQLVNEMSAHAQELFQGLREFRVVAKDRRREKFDNFGALSPGERKDFFDKFEKILLSIKKVEGLDVYFENFMFHAATAQRIMKFVADNNIPLHFL